MYITNCKIFQSVLYDGKESTTAFSWPICSWISQLMIMINIMILYHNLFIFFSVTIHYLINSTEQLVLTWCCHLIYIYIYWSLLMSDLFCSSLFPQFPVHTSSSFFWGSIWQTLTYNSTCRGLKWYVKYSPEISLSTICARAHKHTHTHA